MSNPQAKQERSKAKDKRQSPAPDTTPKRRPGKKHKPVIVEYRLTDEFFPGGFNREWQRFGRYRTVEEAEKVIKGGLRKRKLYEYRIVV